MNTGGVSCTTDTLQILGDTSCIATYRLNGDATDLSGNYNGTATSVTYVAGQFGDAGSFNGSSSNVNISGLTMPTTTSVSMWIKPTNTTQNSYVFSSQTSGYRKEYPMLIWFPDSASYNGFAFNTGTDSWIISSTVAASSVWHHVVGIKNSNGSGSLYVDNVLIGTAVSGTTYTPIAGFNFGCLNDADDGGLVGYFNGSIDQVRIFNKTITAAEVTTLYNEVQCP